MLHNNISATHKAFAYAVPQVEANPVYDELKPQTIKPIVINGGLADTGQNSDEVVLSSPEQRNYLFAKNIAQHRNTLKSMLAQIPLAALWLLDNDGQDYYRDLSESSEENPATAGEEYQRLAFCYKEAEQLAFKTGLESAVYLEAKQRLTEALTEMALTAEQLKKLATIVTNAYVLQSAFNIKQSQADKDIQQALVKRMKKLAIVNLDKLKHELRQLGLYGTHNGAFTAFLLPPDNDLHTSLRHLVRTEELWLSARQRLAEANSRLVLYLANQYKGGFLEFNDLVQEGQSGLLKAVDRYDYQRGFKFSTYAVYWIRQGISRALTRCERVVRLPFGQMANISKVHRAKEIYFAKTGQEMPIKDLAEYMQLSESEIDNILLIGQGATSLDMSVGDDESDSVLADFMEQGVYKPAAKTIAANQLVSLINTALSQLSEKEAQVLCCRFGIQCHCEMTLEEIGQELGLTRERVRQIQATALNKLRQQYGADLVNFL